MLKNGTSHAFNVSRDLCWNKTGTSGLKELLNVGNDIFVVRGIILRGDIAKGSSEFGNARVNRISRRPLALLQFREVRCGCPVAACTVRATREKNEFPCINKSSNYGAGRKPY